MLTLRRAAVLLLGGLVPLATIGIKRWHGPLLGAEDVTTHEYVAWYVEKNVHFGWTGAHITLWNDGVFYPYGTLAAFQTYQFEANLLYAALHSRFGQGPWLALHFLLSAAVSALGVLFILAREIGVPRAAFVSFAATFMNFYALLKWPYHANLPPLHWMLLGMAADFVLFRRIVHGERVTTPWLLVRAALFLDLFGLDLGYVAGFGLTSFVITSAFAVVVLARRRTLAPVWPSLAEVRAARGMVLLAVALAALPLYLYLPLTLDVVRATRHLHFDGPGGNMWASQARILFPYLPPIDPGSPFIARLFGTAEGVGELQVGWFLLFGAVFGAIDARRARSLMPFAPLLVTFAISFAYNPGSFPILRVFPWFAFDRAAGRATIFFPLVCALLATAIDAPRRRRALRVLATIGALELTTGWWLVARAPAPLPPPPDFDAYMTAIRTAPGEAIFDWPFCVTGGNGVGARDLCPFYDKNANVYAYRRFHQKKVIGQYMSRLHPSQLTPYLEAGWPALFAPDDPDPRRGRRQVRCWDAREWDFVLDMIVAGRFAGFSLYPELLPEDCVREFHARFGAPVATTTLNGVGRAEFLAVPPALRARPVSSDARALRLARP
jgi:hypothetical protein